MTGPVHWSSAMAFRICPPATPGPPHAGPLHALTTRALCCASPAMALCPKRVSFSAWFTCHPSVTPPGPPLGVASHRKQHKRILRQSSHLGVAAWKGGRENEASGRRSRRSISPVGSSPLPTPCLAFPWCATSSLVSRVLLLHAQRSSPALLLGG